MGNLTMSGKRGLKKPGDVVAHYRLDHLLGAGCEGEVYRAIDLRVGAVRTVKLLRGRNMTAMAAHTAAYFHKLRHVDSVKRFREWGVLHGQPAVGRRAWLAFDYVRGKTLPLHLKQQKSIDLRSLMVELCDVVDRVHQCGLGVGDFDYGRNIIVEAGKKRLVLCDADAGVVGAENRDLNADLPELEELCRLIYRARGLRPDPKVMGSFVQARSVSEARSRLIHLPWRTDSLSG